MQPRRYGSNKRYSPPLNDRQRLVIETVRPGLDAIIGDFGAMPSENQAALVELFEGALKRMKRVQAETVFRSVRHRLALK